jgi:hypothetical protein
LGGSFVSLAQALLATFRRKNEVFRIRLCALDDFKKRVVPPNDRICSEFS